MLEKFLLLALFGIAMAHFEGVIVVYLRKAPVYKVKRFLSHQGHSF